MSLQNSSAVPPLFQRFPPRCLGRVVPVGAVGFHPRSPGATPGARVVAQLEPTGLVEARRTRAGVRANEFSALVVLADDVLVAPQLGQGDDHQDLQPSDNGHLERGREDQEGCEERQRVRLRVRALCFVQSKGLL